MQLFSTNPPPRHFPVTTFRASWAVLVPIEGALRWKLGATLNLESYRQVTLVKNPGPVL